MKRYVEPEILDALPADDPAAIASRRDLRLINRIMGNTRWLRQTLLRRLRPQDLVVELGAGDGILGKSLRWPGEYTAFDLAPMPPDWPEDYDWIQGDCFTIGKDHLAKASVVVGGLILHHFSAEALRALGEAMKSARLLIFCEPARRKRHLWQGRALRLLGINHVTQHDLPISVRAGFLGTDLAEMLALGPEWTVSVKVTFFGGYRFCATR
jgi:SAM-dependent methyltransferase